METYKVANGCQWPHLLLGDALIYYIIESVGIYGIFIVTGTVQSITNKVIFSP